jgi:hypothetical protein
MQNISGICTKYLFYLTWNFILLHFVSYKESSRIIPGIIMFFILIIFINKFIFLKN